MPREPRTEFPVPSIYCSHLIVLFCQFSFCFAYLSLVGRNLDYRTRSGFKKMLCEQVKLELQSHNAKTRKRLRFGKVIFFVHL